MPEATFNVVPKDPKEKHVAENARDDSVDKHRGDEGEINRNWRGLKAGHLDALTRDVLHYDRAGDDVFASDDLAGNRRICVGEFFVSAESLQENEYQNVYEDQDVVNDRCASAPHVVVAYWK